MWFVVFFFFQAEDGIRDHCVTGVQTCALPILLVRVLREAGDSTLQRIARLVEEAQATKAPAEQFVDRFSRLYTPIVVAAAIVLAVVPPLLGGEFGIWFYRALALLIIACPCALVISTPVTVVSGIGAASRRGILVKGGAALET